MAVEEVLPWLGDDLHLEAEFVDQQKTADMALVAKQESIKDFDANFIPIAQTLEATFRAAGEVELADRIRPTIRRLTRPNEDEALPPPEEGAESTEDSAAATTPVETPAPSAA